MDRERINILLVESSEPHATLIREALEAGHLPVKLTLAQNLAEAHAFLNESFPHLAIVDLLLPDGHGVELLLTQKEKTAYPVVILSCQGNEHAAVEAVKSGAVDYVVKSSATLADMPRVVERALREWRHITESKKTHEELQASDEMFRSFFDSSATGMAIVDLEGKVLRVNPTLCRLSGYSEAETQRMSALEVTHPDDREKTQHLYDEIRMGRRSVVDYEKRYLCKDGSSVWGRVTMAGVFAPDGALRYFAVNVQDITEAKRAQRQALESAEKLQLVLDNIPQHVFWKDLNSVYLGCNSNLALAAGMEKPQDVIGKTDYDLAWKKEEADFYRECDRRVMDADTPEFRIVEPQLQASGRQAWLETNKIPLHDSKGRVVGILGTYEDITVRKQAEELLKESNRELKVFAYTVSHDLRAPLTPILGYAEFLQATYGEQLDERAVDCLEEIQGQVHKMIALMEDLLVLANVGYLERPAEPTDLQEVVQQVQKDLARNLAAAGLELKIGALPKLRVPQSLLTQTFANLIGNAAHYAGEAGGPIEVGGERAGGRVRFFVRDHGPGVPEEEQSRIFDVFCRGSIGRPVAGTGIGLATVNKIVKLYDGATWVEDTLGGGATFFVEMAG